MRSLVLFVFLLVNLLLTGGCGLLFGGDDDSLGLNLGGNNGGNNQGGQSAFEVHASGGTTPIYTWDGGGAHSVSVVHANNPANLVWSVAFLGLSDGIASGVVHGTVPGSSVEAIRTEPVLTPGVTYRVSVAKSDGTTVGWTEFTP